MVPACFLYPVDVVLHLAPDLIRSLSGEFFQHIDSDGVRLGEILRIFRHADPTERAEAVVEEHRPHDVLYVGRVAEPLAVGGHDVGSGARALQEEGVAVVEEIHPLGCKSVDRCYLTPQ